MDEVFMRKRMTLIALLLALITGSVAFAQGRGPASEDFNLYRLSDGWTFVNPAETAVMRFLGTNTPDAWLQIEVPGGEPQDVWFTGNNAPRVLQAVGNVDFEVETRFESTLTRNGQSQGFIVEQDQGNWLQVYLTVENNQVTLIAAAASNYSLNLNEPYVRQTIAPTGTAPLWLRLKRTTNDWVASYSLDGSNFTDSEPFSHRIAVASLGLYAGVNSFFGDAPAFTMVADYFFNTASPIAAEDGATVEDLFEPQILFLDPLPYDNRIVLNWQSDEPAAVTVDYGVTGNFELGTLTVAELNVAHSIELPELLPGEIYNVRITSSDGLGNEGAIDPFTVTTLTAPPVTPVIEMWYGDTQSFGMQGIPQRFVNVLGSVSDTDLGDRIQMTFSVNDGPDQRLSVGADVRRLAGAGDFNIEIPLEILRDGENEILIKASDRYGNRSNIVMSVFYSDSAVWSIPYNLDWAAIQNPQAAVQLVDGYWQITPEGLRTQETGYRRMFAIGDISWQDYEVLAPFVVHALTPMPSDTPRVVDPEPYVGIMPRWTGYYQWDDSQPAVGFVPVGSLARYMWRTAVQTNNVVDGLELLDGGLGPNAQDLSQLPIYLETQYLMRMRVVSSVDGGAFYSVRFWRADEAEPEWWNVASSVPPGGTTAGSIAFVAHRADVTFGNIQVMGLMPDAYLLQAYDNTPPECDAVVTGSSANLRADANPNAGVVSSLPGGAQITVNGQRTGTDGALWYRSLQNDALLWFRADLATLDAECEGLLSLDAPAS